MVLPRKPGGDPSSQGLGTSSEFVFDSIQLANSTQSDIFQAGRVPEMIQAVLQGYLAMNEFPAAPFLHSPTTTTTTTTTTV
jgi:hypothetical protein